MPVDGWGGEVIAWGDAIISAGQVRRMGNRRRIRLSLSTSGRFRDGMAAEAATPGGRKKARVSFEVHAGLPEVSGRRLICPRRRPVVCRMSRVEVPSRPRSRVPLPAPPRQPPGRKSRRRPLPSVGPRRSGRPTADSTEPLHGACQSTVRRRHRRFLPEIGGSTVGNSGSGGIGGRFGPIAARRGGGDPPQSTGGHAGLARPYFLIRYRR